MKTVSVHDSASAFETDPNGKNCSRIFDNWESKLPCATTCHGLTKRFLTGSGRSEARKVVSPEKIKTILQQPFPERERNWFTDAMAFMEWSDRMFKGAYPSRKAPAPSYDPLTTVAVHLTADEVNSILIKTEIAKTKKLRPRMEAMLAEGKTIALDINDWSRVILALCGAGGHGVSDHKRLLKLGTKIANQSREALDIDGPPVPVK